MLKEIVLIAIVAVVVAIGFRKIFNPFVVFGIAFGVLLCLYYQMISLVSGIGPSRKIVRTCSWWYLSNFPDTFGYFVILLPYATAAGFICFATTFTLTTVISPITYNIFRFKAAYYI